MIYTIGRKSVYDLHIEHNPQAMKIGRSDDYPGGSVWRTPEEARQYLADENLDDLDDFDVYGVEADWEKDTEPSNGGPWHDLLRDARLVRL